MNREPLSSVWQELRTFQLSEAESDNVKHAIGMATKSRVREGGVTCHKQGMDPRTFLRQAGPLVELSKEDDADAQSKIMRFAREHPLSEVDVHISVERVFSIFHSFLRPAPVLTAALLFVVCGVTFSFAAEATLPGDFLYPFKINVNERAQASLIFTTDTRAHFEAERLERRLDEAATLVASHRFDGKVRSTVSQGINTQLLLTQAALASLAQNGDHDAALAMHTVIESNLMANATVLASMVDASGNTVEEAKELLLNVSQAGRKISTARTAEEAAASALADERSEAERSLKLAMNHVQDAQIFIEQKKSAADPSIVVQSNARFDFAKRMLSAARTNFDAEKYEEATRSGGEAQRAALEAKAMLRISAKVLPYLK